jgi:cation diffusion facilitator family transporter
MNLSQTETKTHAATASVVSNSALVLGKLLVGLAIGSVSILSEAIHSGIDLVAALIAWWAVRASAEPADDEHPYGHGKYENLSGALEALLILVAACWIIVEGVKKLIHPTPLESTGVGIAIMAVSAIANFFISSWLMRVGRATDSVALTADAWHLRTDVYTSLGVMLGLASIAVLRHVVPARSFNWIDPVVALAVALFIMKAAIKLTIGAVRDLLDSRLPLDELGSIENYVQSRGDVLGYHDLRTRKAGNWRFVEIHLELPPDMTVRDSHAIAHSVSIEIQERLPSTSVMVHVDPSDQDPPSSRQKRLRSSSVPRP